MERGRHCTDVVSYTKHQRCAPREEVLALQSATLVIACMHEDAAGGREARGPQSVDNSDDRGKPMASAA